METGFDVKGDPATSGPDGCKFEMKAFLVPIMGNAFALKDFKERTPDEQEKFSNWCNRLKWYMALCKVGYEPSFGSDS